MIDLERVATFIAVVKCGGFREAAKQTGLSQPTVTQHIKRLEQSLQARLIDRATMPQSLTLEGKIFFPYAEQLLRTSHKATAALHNKSLVVGESSNIGIYLLQPYIKALQDKLANKIDVALRHFVWNPTVTMTPGRRARWACVQAAGRPVHMSTRRV